MKGSSKQTNGNAPKEVVKTKGEGAGGSKKSGMGRGGSKGSPKKAY